MPPRPGEELAAALEAPGFYAGDPFPHYARLRRDAPVAWNAQLGYWAVSKHADVVAISRDPETFCSGKGILTFEIGVEYATPPTMMHTDPPEHTRYRKLVQPGFAPSRIRELGVRVRVRADELVARLEPGQPFDAVEQLAVPFPLWIIAELLGIPEADWPRFYQWSEASIPGATDWPPEACARLQAEMHEYLLAMTKARRGRPRDDIVSVLANAEGESLRDDELVMFLNQLLVVGNETTRHAISGGIAALAERPEQWERLAADRSLVHTATEEILRWTTPVISFMRTATRDTQVHGVDITAGDPLVLLYASANRDEDEFGRDADLFDVARDPNHQVALGFGPHFCLGAALALIEIAAMLEALLDRFPAIASAGSVSRTASFVIAGITRAPVCVFLNTTVITPAGDAYRGEHVQLDLPALTTGARVSVAAPDGTEAALVLLRGDVDIDGRHAQRSDVFDARATAVYLPPGCRVEVIAHAPTELALAATVGADLRAPEGAGPCFVAADHVVAHDRGRPGWQRSVHDVIAGAVPAQRLLVGETFNEAGQWSSFPPHKHDGGDGEPALEEVYYFRFDQRDGFGFQGLYEHAGPARAAEERAVFLRHGAVVGIPRGYHPVCAAPGYRLYYLWALSPAAGAPVGLALHEDPSHRWLHDLELD